jgi:hypothetical protein
MGAAEAKFEILIAVQTPYGTSTLRHVKNIKAKSTLRRADIGHCTILNRSVQTLCYFFTYDGRRRTAQPCRISNDTWS